MVRYTLARLLRAIGTLWLAVTLVFVGLRLSGDPAAALLGPEANPEAVEALRRAWGLDRPLPLQYATYLSNLVHGDFGRSLRDRRPATEVVHERLPVTARLAAVSLALAVAIGVPAGVLAAFRHGRIADRLVMAGALLGQGLPNFVLGLLLILLFAFHLRWLPSGGQQGASSMILPALTLSTYGVASLARFTRSAVLEVIHQDYLRTAYAKGLPTGRVLVDHVGRNAALTLVTVLGLQLSVAIAGAVVTETVFAWPGMGRLLAQATEQRDFPVVQYGVFVIVLSVVAVNFVVDLLYGLIDPRIRSAV